MLNKLLPEGKCLVTGLGNPSVASDSLGWRTAGRVLATSHFIEKMHNADGIGTVSYTHLMPSLVPVGPA